MSYIYIYASIVLLRMLCIYVYKHINTYIYIFTHIESHTWMNDSLKRSNASYYQITSFDNIMIYLYVCIYIWWFPISIWVAIWSSSIDGCSPRKPAPGGEPGGLSSNPPRPRWGANPIFLGNFRGDFSPWKRWEYITSIYWKPWYVYI